VVVVRHLVVVMQEAVEQVVVEMDLLPVTVLQAAQILAVVVAVVFNLGQLITLAAQAAPVLSFSNTQSLFLQ
jgi:hypothetical protein